MAGRKTRIDHGNEAITTNTYDCGDRLTVIEHRRSDDSIVNLTTYSYDDAGNRIGALEHDGTVTTWTYDDTYQLTREQRSGTGSFDVSYGYDAAGNRTLQDDSGALTTYTYDAANRLLSESSSTGLTTYTYDDDGNRTQKDTPSDITYYSWDEDSRLTSAEPVAGAVTFSYNADGRRVEKETPSETTRFVYDGNKLLQETDGSGSVEQQYLSTLAEWGELVSGYDGLETSTYHYDAIGTTDALLDEDETATDRYRHRAFGAEQSHTGSSENPFTFVGRQGYYRDEELALYLAGARYYDPAAGRWLSQDPIRFDGGDANLYRYVKNNPVNAVDPSGLVEFGFLPDPLAHATVHNAGYWFGSTDIELAMEALQLAALYRALQKAKSELEPNKHRDIGYDLEGYRSPWLIIGLMRILEHNREVDQARMNLATLKELNQQLGDIEEAFGKGPLSTVDFYSPVRPANSLFPDTYPEEPSRPLGIGLKGALAALESGHQIGFVDGPIEQSDFSPVEIAFLGSRLLFSATRSIARTLVVRRTVLKGEEIAVAVRRHLDSPPPPAARLSGTNAATAGGSGKLDTGARVADSTRVPASQPARPATEVASASGKVDVLTSADSFAARRAYLNQKFGRTGNLDVDINARAGITPRTARAAEQLGNTGENAAVLRRNLALEGRPVGAGEAAGHLVPSTGSQGHWAAGARSRQLLQHYDVRINSGANGIPIGHPRPHNLTHRGPFLRDLESRLHRVVELIRTRGYGHNATRSALQRELRAIGREVPRQ